VHSEYCFPDLSLEGEDFILIAHYLAIFLVNVKKLKHLEVGLSSLGILVHFKIITLP
jgi:predicted branched-subunit amino acid permease